MKPTVAIIGRPNVGKSTFFNKISGKRISIVDDMPGVTRDRIYCDAEWCGKAFTMIDTGGIEVSSEDKMWLHIRTQAELAVDLANVIVFFVDGKAGLVAEDYEVAKYLRKSNKPVIVAVNKLDNNEIEKSFEFYELGFEEVYPISAEQAQGLGDLLDAICAHFNEGEGVGEEDDSLKIAVVGRPNAGKSSIVNKILGYDRVIVSDIEGTTRDAIDTKFKVSGKEYTIIDTAGMRRKKNISEDVEQYSVMRSIAAIKRADVVIVVFDATKELSEQDIRIAGYVHEQGKPSIIAMNKWDLVEKDTNTIYKFKKELDEKLKFMDYYTPIFISALTGQRMGSVIDNVNIVYESNIMRVPTGVLNDTVQEAIMVNPPPMYKGRELKIYYATQVSVKPPTFVLFVNNDKLLHFSYKRYIENSIRKAFKFVGSPIRIIFRNKNKDEIG
ncbi:MAG: ribosome biogenesis GTPase Der [Clostridia bacterium]|nr:ribosome biogenesis GTPase Der [Clostridia bacterium]MDY5263567.1 ribosome biogenesis GTPase Der [Eubacteriales bacterium]